MFKIEVIGNLGADAEVKEAQGRKFVTMRIAHSEKWKDADGKDRESTIWIDGIMSNADSKILPYLKQGVKVFVRGHGSLRVYSSPKDRMMKAGAQVNVQEIELVGGSSELVPRQIIDPDNGQVFDTQKYYWINRENKDIKKDEVKVLVDTKGNEYVMNKQGFVAPKPEDNQAPTESEQAQG